LIGSEPLIIKCKREIASKFKTKDLRFVHYFLGGKVGTLYPSKTNFQASTPRNITWVFILIFQKGIFFHQTKEY